MKRPNGEGTVRKRSDGRWEGRIIIGHKENGKPIYKSVFAKTQKELIPKLHREIELYKDVEITENRRITLGEWLDKWLNEHMKYAIRESTLKSYRNMSEKYIKPILGHKYLNTITTNDIQKMYNALKKNGRSIPNKDGSRELADSTIRHTHAMLHHALDDAVRKRLIMTNPTNGAAVPKCNLPPKQILNDEELARFMEIIKTDEVWHDFFYTEITTGLRRGEICALKWIDFDEKAGTLKIRRSANERNKISDDAKTASGNREILLAPSTAKLLSARKKESLSQWIFPNPYKPEACVNPQRAYYKMKELLKKADLPPIRFHDLRHTFATHALASGVDAKTLSGILGHTNASFTLDTYTHITTDMQKNAANIVGSFIDEFIERT